MLDLVYVLLTIGLFAALAVVVRAVERLVNATNVIGLVLAVGLTAFLVVALLFPERF